MTQTHKLYQILKNGDPVPVQKIADELRIAYYSVAVYIHELKHKFKGKVNSIRDGRKVVAYQLMNASEIKVPEYRRTYFAPAKPKANALTTLADELEAVNSGGVSEKEFADIRSSLGLGDTFGGNSNGGWD